MRKPTGKHSLRKPTTDDDGESDVSYGGRLLARSDRKWLRISPNNRLEFSHVVSAFNRGESAVQYSVVAPTTVALQHLP